MGQDSHCGNRPSAPVAVRVDHDSVENISWKITLFATIVAGSAVSVSLRPVTSQQIATLGVEPFQTWSRFDSLSSSVAYLKVVGSIVFDVEQRLDRCVEIDRPLAGHQVFLGFAVVVTDMYGRQQI